MRRYENVDIKKLIPYDKNAKIHPKEQVEQIANSIKEFGFINPILIDEKYNIIAGHGRVLGAKKLNMKEVPCLFVEDLTETQKRAYILADNKLTENAEWDLDILKEELTALNDLEFDIELTGFDNKIFEFEIDGEDFGTDFELESGEKNNLEQITFTLSSEQAETIKKAMKKVKDQIKETFGNENSKGNQIYEVVRQWEEQKKL